MSSEPIDVRDAFADRVLSIDHVGGKLATSLHAPDPAPLTFMIWLVAAFFNFFIALILAATYFE